MEKDRLRRITTARIHPALGIARIGNSDQDFVGPEIPGAIAYPAGGYRDDLNQLKRQAARFRVFGYDGNDRCVGEITSADAKIEWTVHLMNTKAVGRRFGGVLHPEKSYRNEGWIKRGISRQDFILDGLRKTVSRDHPKALFECDSFMGVKFKCRKEPESGKFSYTALELGRAIYEESGRLRVLGGHGHSGSPVHAPLDEKGQNDFANHDGWFDDISDGPVTCKMKLEGVDLQVKPAWIVVGPPKYAPELYPVVTLYDTLYQVAINRALIENPFSNPQFRPSFNRHIYPILKRAMQMPSVFNRAVVGHSPMTTGPGEPNERQHVFRQFRVPSNHPLQPGTGTGRMPFMWSDLYNEPSINATLTPFQYCVMQHWADGDFDNDWDGNPPRLSYRITPEGLDRAALEPCIGAAFFPGIEVSWKIRDVFQYLEPFRLDHDSLSPGDISQQMSLPWQTDFIDCAYEDPYVWWPSQRPIDVLMHPGSQRVQWARPFGTANNQPEMSARQMVHDFHRLGYVLRVGEEFYETGRVDRRPDRQFNDENFARKRK